MTNIDHVTTRLSKGMNLLLRMGASCTTFEFMLSLGFSVSKEKNMSARNAKPIAKSWRKNWVVKSLKLPNRNNFSQVMVAEIEYINYFLISNKHIFLLLCWLENTAL